MENNENKNSEEKEVKDEKSETSTNKGSDKGLNEVDKLKFDVEHWKNEYYRAYADMANLRKTMEKDQREANKYRIEGFVQNLLGVLDAFDMAFKNDATTEELKNYLTGFQYVHRQLIQVLTDEGILEISPKAGDKFDVYSMHAIEVVEDHGEENVVKSVTLKGYKLYEHLIRPAMVVVTKHPSEKKDDSVKNKDEDVKKDANDEKKVC